MSAKSEQIGFDRTKLLMDEDVWEGIFERLVRDSPETADCVADLLFRILQAATSGRKGADRAAHTLKCGIRWVYQYTGAHHAGFEAYLRYLDGRMLTEDEPEQLMRDAINRGLSQVARPRAPRLRKR
ncbi:MAG: hypothetical protein ACREDR_05130 [Blastocatellia bacterium]